MERTRKVTSDADIVVGEGLEIQFMTVGHPQRKIRHGTRAFC